MRTILQPWDALRVAHAVDDGTDGVDGLTATCRIRRVRDDAWLQSDGSWSATVASLTMTEVDATDLPGVYQYAIPPASVSPLLDHAGFYVEAKTAGTVSIAHMHLVPMTSERIATGYTRTVYHTWTGDLPATGTLYLYASSTLLDADTAFDGTGARAAIPLVWTYDALGRVTRVEQG
jgi:hypothetical protein